ncbi:SigE family RNA polymerase sigma factor [Actinomadura alba]|uniref:SigE family RNA polymerase sigma factor n=1 Tax=Actinomadura alba TaxID=406431 RepID=A0ABR7LLB8_9ACTN|nr:SigE family RNA polymerase sigma factor [Actinomadura alba]MBC6465661.1 SigE family RNA polymerase sigma factor [Actinomadura alba]
MSDSGFTDFVKAIRPDMRRQAYLLCGDWYEADDLVQQTLIKVLLRWQGLDRRDELAGYTRTVLVRTFISDHRAPRWSREFPYDRLPEPDPEHGAQEGVADRLLLLDALARLTLRQRAAIVLLYWEHLSANEAADILDCSVSTVRSQAFRALARLRSILRAETLPAGSRLTGSDGSDMTDE